MTTLRQRGVRRVADIACGTGSLADRIERRLGVEEVHGVDLSEGMLAQARKRSDRVQWSVGCAEELPLGDGFLDAVVTTPAFHFFDHQRAALRESSPRTEITWLVPDSRLEDEMVPGVAQTRRLDIDAEIVKYGAATQGGPRGDRALMARMMAVLSAQSR